MLAMISLVASLLFLVLYGFILIKAFRDEVLQGVLCVLLPVYTIYYALAKLQSENKALLLALFFGTMLVGPGLQSAGLVTSKDDACKLLPKGEVELILREPVASPPERRDVRTAAGEGKFCGYQTQAVPIKLVGMVVVRECPSLQPLRDAAKGMKFDLNDVGDEGYYGSSELAARSGNTCFVFLFEETGAMSMMSAYDKLEINRRLAEVAMSQLPQ